MTIRTLEFVAGKLRGVNDKMSSKARYRASIPHCGVALSGDCTPEGQ